LLLEHQRFGGDRFCAARPQKLCQRDNQVDRENKEITYRLDYETRNIFAVLDTS